MTVPFVEKDPLVKMLIAFRGISTALGVSEDAGAFFGLTTVLAAFGVCGAGVLSLLGGGDCMFVVI